MKGFFIGLATVIVIAIIGVFAWVYGDQIYNDTKQKVEDTFITETENTETENSNENVELVISFI